MEYYISILKKGITIVFTIFAIILAGKISIFYIPFIVAYIISIIIDPLIKWICKKTNITRKVSSIIILFLIFLVLIIIITIGISNFISEATNLLNNLNEYLDKGFILIGDIISKIDFNKINFSEDIRKAVEGYASNIINETMSFIQNTLGSILVFITSIPSMLIYVMITLLATYFISSDKFYILDRMEHHIPKKAVGKIIKFKEDIKSSLGGYIKAQITLTLISFVIVLIGLNLFYILGMNIEYPILMALLIGFVDALPILGSGTVMVPWSIILVINKDFSTAMCIFGLYLVIVLAKQVLEPKIVSKKIGIHPFFTLVAMYTGFKIIGVFGLLIGPIALIFLKTLFSTAIDKGIVKAIVEE